jgi:hypothetical protein
MADVPNKYLNTTVSFHIHIHIISQIKVSEIIYEI